ncbi:MAG: LL-diaminopimelate aminotransferase [Oscillospiraceae bacterium]|jgi:LL-diaminopimelate aminotransferase|nr:LL-diaminopimelate aminotransferase [Oscillospiraceae bacterium]
MANLNENFLKLKKNYLFVEIGQRVKAYAAANPDKNIIRMGIGDVTLPLPAAVVAAFEKAVREQGVKETFRGYEDSGLGYDFLRDRVSDYYKAFGVSVDSSEVLISDGAKSDCGNFGDIFSPDNTVLVSDPVYPVYVDSNIMGGRTIITADSNRENGFRALPNNDIHADIIYLCSPNNPTGSVYTKDELKLWVDYANNRKSVIVFDAAYEAFISEPDLPRSIFQIDGARTCAVEICSLSKTAGFTGTRCGYTVIPKELNLYTSSNEAVNLGDTWRRRQGSKFNGVSYPVQRAAEAVFSDEGQAEVKANLDYYKTNAKIITDTLDELNVSYTGGKNSPYIWFTSKRFPDSWALFDKLLNDVSVVGTPGSGFGKNGEGWFRLTAFSTNEKTAEAMKRIRETIQL